jgi:hypothetical protein
MKALASIIVGIITFYLIIFQFDPWVVGMIMDAVPPTEWFALIKIIVWIVVLFFTLSFAIWFSIFIGSAVAMILYK